MNTLSQIVAMLAAVAPAAAQTTVDIFSGTSTYPRWLPSTYIPNTAICPTLTLTADVCATCAVPQCITVSTLTRPCGCSAPDGTVFVDFPCKGTCGRIGCSTSYTFVSGEVDCDATATSGPVPSTVEATVTITAATVVSETETATTTAEAVTTTVTDQATDAAATTATPNAAGRLAVPFRFW